MTHSPNVAVTTFHDDDAGWFRWLDSNPTGFFMQQAASGAGLMMHRSNCPHVDREEVWADGRVVRWTKRAKFCAVDQSELDLLAHQQTGLQARLCRHCF